MFSTLLTSSFSSSESERDHLFAEAESASFELGGIGYSFAVFSVNFEHTLTTSRIHVKRQRRLAAFRALGAQYPIFESAALKTHAESTCHSQPTIINAVRIMGSKLVENSPSSIKEFGSVYIALWCIDL